MQRLHSAGAILLLLFIAHSPVGGDKYYGYPGRPWDGHAFAAEKYHQYAGNYQQYATGSDPPPHEEVVRMARYIVHNTGKVKI